MKSKTGKRVILMGAISSFCDLVNEIALLGIEPLICDYFEDAPAKKMGYPSYEISTTDVDELTKLALKYEVDGVISAFSDRNLIPALELCQRLKCRHFFDREIIDCLTDKQKMKAFFMSMNIPVIKYGVFSLGELDVSLKDFIYPVVTKPLDAYGSKGIFVCNDIDDVKASYDAVLKESLKYSDRIIIEEFYRADEISVSAWVHEGKAYITCIYDVFRNFDGGITLSAVSFPSKYTVVYYENILSLLNRIVQAIGISEGPVTLQCFIGNRGIKVSELLCRLAGGSPYLYATYLGGPNIAKMVIQNAVGQDIDYQNLESFKPIPEDDEVYYAVEILIKDKGMITYDIDQDRIKEENQDVIDVRIHYPCGAELINVGSSGIQFAKVICRTRRNTDYNELIGRLDGLIEVYNMAGDKVSFIRKPERINVTDVYEVGWDFMEN